MTAINVNERSQGLQGVDEAIAPNPRVSDTQQMENNFISLMVAQIKNQDPTKPVDSTEFLNQFSAMSQVKSMENMATLSKSNLVLMDNLQTLTAAGLVGQDVDVAVDQIEFGDQPINGHVNLQHPAGATAMVLTDSSGAATVVKLGAHGGGAMPFTLDPAELKLAPGKYRVEVETDSGEHPQVEVKGRVQQVRTSAEGPVLDIAGAGATPFYQITGFGQTGARQSL